ncbi:MAG: hypothetical protein IJ060_11065 [Oscillospiraceae bacterium]|nr:hypothetical protein [Oscillospiraceae bacterium]
MNILSRFYHRVFDDLPKIMRIICLVVMILFAFLGVLLTLRAAVAADIGLFNAVGYIFMFCLFGTVTVLILAGIWHLLVKGTKVSLPLKLQSLFEQQGFSTELSDTAKSGNPFPSLRERLQQVFILTMSEQYKAAESAMLTIDATSLSGRESAVYYTCRLQIAAMTSQHEKLQKIFNEQQKNLDRAYEMMPDLTEPYFSYTDDALAYYMLAAVITAHRGRADLADNYEKLADFQISKRSEPEIQFYSYIMRLNRLYATGKLVDAHDEENHLKGALLNSIMPAGIQRSMLQLIDKARIFSTLPEDKSEILAERKLPPQGTAAAPAPAPSAGIPDLPELF